MCVRPIHDIRVTFRGYAIRRVHLEPGGQELEVRKAGDALEVPVRRLAVHSLVVAELA
jgi:hypothetical protein